MSKVTASLNRNVLKLSLLDKNGVSVVSQVIAKDTVNGIEILDVQKFSSAFTDTLKKLTTVSPKKLDLNFLLEPETVGLNFIGVDKQKGEADEIIVSEIKTKLEGVDLESLYFSYRKIAPFSYQFVGVERERVEKYIELATNVGINLRGIFSWVSLLPKYVETNESCIFIVKDEEKHLVALSEFGGIYFVGVYEKELPGQKLTKLVRDLSIYQRAEPVTKVYALDYDNLTVDTEFEMERLVVNGAEEEAFKGFEHHFVFYKVADGNNGKGSVPINALLSSQLNLLNLLPVPVKTNNNKVLIAAGGVAVPALIVGILFGGMHFLDWNVGFLNGGGDSAVEAEVLSETSESTQSEGSGGQGEAVAEESDEGPEELDKSELVIKVENGNGVVGAAGQARDVLKEKGYVVSDIGNAEENRETTLLQFKEDKAKYKDLLIEDLKDEFELVVQDDLDEEAEFDLLVIVGQK